MKETQGLAWVNMILKQVDTPVIAGISPLNTSPVSVRGAPSVCRSTASKLPEENRGIDWSNYVFLYCRFQNGCVVLPFNFW